MKYGKRPKGVRLIIKDENSYKIDKQIYLLRKKARQENFEHGEPSVKTVGELHDLGWHTAYWKYDVKVWPYKLTNLEKVTK